MADNGIYRIRNLTNNKCYIGSAAGYKGFAGRWSEHTRDAHGQRHHSVIFQRAWNKYGSGVFVFEVLEQCLPAQCIEREQYWLDTLQPEYNVAKQAGSVLGLRWKLSDETKIKIGNAHRGRKHSLEARLRMSQGSKGKTAGEINGRSKLTADDVLNIRNSYTGKHGELSQLARQYDVAVSTIDRIVKKILWSSI